ncbi:MAG TPA: NHLP bacteriocin export ABC transporter permease/ATPase subunit, partial [Longimicrobium sp.]|nr:NHLP bacteriocin export ABC transporter permease/ATPase subunit [Longimicrobium sp.]
DRPFLLGGAGAWLVRAGRVDVFAVPVKGGEPAGGRTHLFRVEEGGLLFGTGARADDTVGLLAVGSAGTRVAPVERIRLRAAAMDPSQAPALAELLDGWVDLLCGAVARDNIPDCAEVAPDAPELPGDAKYVRPRGGVAWVRHREGSSLLLGRDGLKMNGDFTPLSRSAWMEVRGSCALDVAETSDVLERGDAFEGLERLHGLVLDCIARMAAETTHGERERLREKAAAGRGAFRGAMGKLAATLNAGAPGTLKVAAEVTGDPLLAACARVGAPQGITVRPYPRERGAPPVRDPLAAIARASRFRTRQVVLRDGWWREDGGAMLAWVAEGEHPVALVPVANARYVLEDPRTGEQTPVTAALADTLKPIAFAFYRPFDDRAMGLVDVLRFGIRGCGRDLWMVVIMSAAAAVLSLVPPIATGMIFNDVIPSADRSQLVQLTLALLVIAAATLFFRLAMGVALVRIEGRMGSATQAAVWDRVLGLPMPFFRPYSAGNLATRVMGIDQIRQALSGATITAVLGGVFSLVQFGLLYHYNVRLAVWGTGLIVLAIAITAVASRIQMASEHRIAILQSKIAGSVLQFLSSIAKLRTAAAEGQAFSIWARGFSEQRQLQFRARSVGNFVAAFSAAYPVVTTLVLYAVALPLMSKGGADALRTGDFMGFMSSFATCLGGMLGASQALLGAMAVVPLFDQAKPILETLPEVDTAKADPGVLSGAIDIERVSFRYNEDGPLILRDLTLRIKAGEFVAFVGPSGSGKSTLLRLLLGFEQPAAGGVYYDGREMAGLDTQAVRRQIGVVLQNGRLMSGDIFTNIAGSSPVSVEDAWVAARMAGFEDDIKSMPMGMHTVISEGAGTLSGGQRQRLMIARAIVQRPRILFFDEATRALDNRTQAIVTESLDRLNATRIVIAHRLSTILHADRIYVIEAGRIVQSGTYDELMAQEGRFAELAKRQLA